MSDKKAEIVYPQTQNRQHLSPKKVIQKHWETLKGRLLPLEVIDTLFAKELISDRVLALIRDEQKRFKQVEILMDHIMCLSDEQIKQFAMILSHTHGISDVGEQLVQDINAVEQSLHEMAKEQLRKHWKELRDRLDTELLIDELYQNKMIHFDDLENIRAERARHKKALVLLAKMMRSSYKEIQQFAQLLTRTEGIKDLGDRLLRDLVSETARHDYSVGPLDSL